MWLDAIFFLESTGAKSVCEVGVVVILKKIFLTMCRCQGEDSSYAGCRNNGTTIQGIEILKKLNVSRGVGENVGALLVFIVVFRILTYLSLRYLHKPK